MTEKTMKLDKLKPMPNNIRMHSETQIREMVRSVKKFGQIRPIVIDEDNMILVGHGLWIAMQKMGETSAKVLQITNLSKADKMKLMLVDNKMYELGTTDTNMLVEVLREIKSVGDLDIPGFETEVLDLLLADVADIGAEINDYGKFEQREDSDMGKVYQQEKTFELNNDKIGFERPAEGEREQPFIICPKCGEKIWL